MRISVYALVLFASLLCSTISYAQNFNPMSSDLYERLDVARGVSPNDLKQAYRRAARKFHPDVNTIDPNSTIKFQKIQEAFEILSDPNKRESWEGFGAKAPSRHEEDSETRTVRRNILRALAAQNPNLADYILNVTSHNYGFNDSREIHFIPKLKPFLPSDRHLLDGLLATHQFEILWAISDSLLTLEVWTDAGELLQRIIEMKVPRVNEYIAQLVVHPNMINAIGASVLRKLIDLGHAEHVVRTLNLGGHLHSGSHQTWDRSPLGLEVLIEALQKMTDEQRRRVDYSVFERGSPWIELLKSRVPAFRMNHTSHTPQS